MNSSLPIATLTLFAGSLLGKSGSTTSPAQLTIRLDDQAQVRRAVLRSATVETDRLFRPAGVRIAWEQLFVAPPEDTDGRCLPVRLVRRTPSTVFPNALGFALPFATSGARVVIFYDRVEALTQSLNTPADVILGHAMAHEIAHVLLGSPKHSTAGLMQAHWTVANWRLATAGLLHFLPAETERIHEGSRKATTSKSQ